MTCTTFLVVVAWASAWPLPLQDEPGALSASGDDGRVRVTVSVDRGTLGPGDVARISSKYEVLVDEPLRFPQGYHRPLEFLYLRTPGGELYVYPEGGLSPKSGRALELGDYQRSVPYKKGPAGSGFTYSIEMVNGSSGWRDPHTFEPARPNLRTIGAYEAWIVYTIPRVLDKPADAWHGSVETKPVRFAVREIPVAERRAEPTAEQMAHLDAYMRYMDDILSGKKTQSPTLEAVEMPVFLSLSDRLRWALERTENEGFARHVVALLRQHQPTENNQPYPKWWGNLSYFIRCRALVRPAERDWKIVGPYLDDYATVVAGELERELAGFTNGSPHSLGPGELVMLLLAYVEYKPGSPIRQRLETLARRYAKIPRDAKPADRPTRSRLGFSWHTLFAQDILRDGMPFADAKEILGEPSE